MVTITHNNRCAEMLATVRRGPFAAPTQEEKVEFLLTRMKKSDAKVAFADHALHACAWRKAGRPVLPSCLDGDSWEIVEFHRDELI